MRRVMPSAPVSNALLARLMRPHEADDGVAGIKFFGAHDSVVKTLTVVLRAFDFARVFRLVFPLGQR